MPEIIDIILPLADSNNQQAWRNKIAQTLNLNPSNISDIRLKKHSIDARQPNIKIQLRLEVALHGETLPNEQYTWQAPPLPPNPKRAIIVGCGPAGMFAALTLLENGWQPIILERGKDASARRFDLAPILRQGTVLEESNYCFGEGGAGTFSDGKLYTRATKRGPIAKVYQILVAHGAPTQILTDAHPHIGSNLLPNVVKAIRQSILHHGGQVHFQTKVTDLILAKNNSILGVTTQDGREFLADATILATGHSARDIYSLLAEKNILMEPKAFAVGFRIEHPQPLIDRIQYHLPPSTPRPDNLPAARYRLATKIRDRGVHSFCMCPGGWIVPAATTNDQVVVNGMSLSRRDSPFANSGLVSTVEPQDTQHLHKQHGILAGIQYQILLEQSAKTAGGNSPNHGQIAPAQRVPDFLAGKISSSLPPTSYFPGTHPAPLHQLLPKPMVERFRQGLQLFGRQIHGYTADHALLLGFETRTSSPLRIPRHNDTLQHPNHPQLYPCGEGAGYAGGIVSAALDGIRIAHAASTP